MRDEMRRHIGRPVMIEIDGNTVGGTLARHSHSTLTLTQASLVVSGVATPMDGEVVLSRAEVIWVQVA